MTKFTRVVPAILTIDPVALEKMIRKAESFIYVGSAIFLQPQPGESFHRLLALAQEK